LFGVYVNGIKMKVIMFLSMLLTLCACTSPEDKMTGGSSNTGIKVVVQVTISVDKRLLQALSLKKVLSYK